MSRQLSRGSAGEYQADEQAINSIYMTAYQSFYPLLITEGNYSKAYSISSVLETVSSVMIPVAAWAYNLVGIAPLLFIDAGSFFIAAVLETRIRAEESYIDLQKKTEDRKHPLRQTVSDIREGARYLTRDKGLLAMLAQGSPIFHSSCEGKLGIALE